MDIVFGNPPNIAQIRKAFDLPKQWVVFSYGGRLYNPSRGLIADHLMVHEEKHAEQQDKFGSADKWWNKYIDDPQFRLSQEGEAYGAQLRFILQHSNRGERRYWTKSLAKDLSSKLYGSIIKFPEAMDLIKKEANI